MKALYAGSFDPPTLGHLDLVGRAAAACEELVVAVGYNPAKIPYLPVETRLELLRADCGNFSNVSIISYQGATADCARRLGISVIVRGLRGPSDLEHEYGMAAVHRLHGLETFFLLAGASHGFVSSSLVREVRRAGLSLHGLVSPRVEAFLLEKTF